MTVSMSAQEAWQAALGQLELQLDRATFDTWVKGADYLAYEDGTFVISVRNAYVKDWLEQRLYRSIRRALADVFGRSVEVRFMVYDPLEPQPGPDLGPLWEEEAEEALPASGAAGSDRCGLNPRYVFATFVVGSSNQLANAAARAVADNPGGAYNPLFIYGDVGLGKTHLLHAIGHACLQNGLNVVYVTAEQFTNDLIDAIRNQSTPGFRNRYRTADVLLVDDIQFIAGKDGTQEEFFHTFNALHGMGRQIVLASDRRPRAMATLEERLRSRFEGGLIVDIQPPDLEMRVAILGTKAEQQRMRLPQDVAQVIANEVRGNVRELEGALTQVVAQSHLTHQPLSLDLVRRVLRDLRAPRRTHSLDAVLETTAAFHRLSLEDLTGPRRTKKIALARQQAMFLAREATEASLPQIGAALGGRDHTTVLHGLTKIAEQMEVDELLRQEIKQLRLKLFEDDEG